MLLLRTHRIGHNNNRVRIRVNFVVKKTIMTTTRREKRESSYERLYKYRRGDDGLPA